LAKRIKAFQEQQHKFQTQDNSKNKIIIPKQKFHRNSGTTLRTQQQQERTHFQHTKNKEHSSLARKNNTAKNKKKKNHGMQASNPKNFTTLICWQIKKRWQYPQKREKAAAMAEENELDRLALVLDLNLLTKKIP
jgi:hypothetical protein